MKSQYKKTMPITRITTFLLALFMALALVVVPLPQQFIASAGENDEILNLSSITLPENSNPKLDSQLNSLASAATPEEAASFAQQYSIELDNGSIRVVIECEAGQIAAVSTAASALGTVETSYTNLIQATVPVSQLTALADITGVKFIRQPFYPELTVVSEGVALINADSWHTGNLTGNGVKVAVLDGGFTGYTSLLGTELPASVTTQSFHSSADINGNTNHGTACAEIVYDVAPNAQMYLVNFGTDVEFGNAVAWLINQGVDIISFSAGWPIGGPGDGTGAICNVVDTANTAGILWAIAAGNLAPGH